MSVTVKSTIRYNGQEYSSLAELPPEVRAAYEKARREAAARFVVDDLMSVIENNGEVTIPNGKAEPLLTKKEIAIVAVFAGGIAALVVARLVMG